MEPVSFSSKVVDFFRKVDEYVFDIGPSHTALERARSIGDSEGVNDAVLRHASAHSYVWSLIFNTLRTVSQVAVVFFDKFSQTSFYQFFQNTQFLLSCTIVGFVTNGISAIYEGFSTIRQALFVHLFHERAWQSNPQQVADDLQALLDRPRTQLDNRLRNWFVDQNIDRPETIVNADGTITERNLPRKNIEEIISRIRNGNVEAIGQGKELLAKVKYQAIKKMIVHVIGFIAAALAVASLIASFVFPLAAPLGLIIASTTVYLIRTLAASGWLDNPAGGFSFRYCMPACILSCWDRIIGSGQEAERQVPLARV